MLNHLRQRVAKIMATADEATLSSSGPAGLQARIFPCESLGIALYLLLPATSDQLLNLEQDETIVVSTPEWEVRGHARILALRDAPAALTLTRLPGADGCVLVEMRPRQLQVYRQDGWGFSETIDIDPNPKP